MKTEEIMILAGAGVLVYVMLNGSATIGANGVTSGSLVPNLAGDFSAGVTGVQSPAMGPVAGVGGGVLGMQGTTTTPAVQAHSASDLPVTLGSALHPLDYV